jgi:hypothetical protein
VTVGKQPQQGADFFDRHPQLMKVLIVGVLDTAFQILPEIALQFPGIFFDSDHVDVAF